MDEIEELWSKLVETGAKSWNKYCSLLGRCPKEKERRKLAARRRQISTVEIDPGYKMYIYQNMIKIWRKLVGPAEKYYSKRCIGCYSNEYWTKWE